MLEIEFYLQTATASRVAVVGGKNQEGQLPTHVQAVAAVNTRDDSVRQMLGLIGRLEAKFEVMILKKVPPPRRQAPVTRYMKRYQPGCWNH